MALVDPNIAMGYRGIELPNQLAQYGQIAQIQNAQNQNQLAQYQLGSAQRADVASNALNQAYRDNTNPDTGEVNFAGINRSLASAGAGSQIPGQLKAQSELATANLTRQKSSLEVEKGKRDFMSQALRDISQNPSDANITAYVEDLNANTLFSSEEKARIHSNANQILAMPIAQRGAFMASQGATPSELSPTLTPQTLGSTTRILSTPRQGGPATVVPGSTANMTMAPGEASRLAISAASADPYNLTGLQARFGGPAAAAPTVGAPKPNISGAIQAGLTGEDFLTHIPTSVANQVRAIGEGRSPSPAARSLSTPAGRQLMELVNQAYPNYDAKEYVTKTAAEKAFVGKRGDTTRSFNVLVDHLGTLQQAADALQNGDTRLFNQAGNFIGLQTGITPPSDFNAVKRIVADEITKAVLGGAAALGDRKSIDDIINAASSPQQLSSAISKFKQLAGGQLNGLEQQYSATTGKTDFRDKFLTPATRAALGTTSTASNIPAAAIADLKAGIGTDAQFDEHFGAGAAARARGGK